MDSTGSTSERKGENLETLNGISRTAANHFCFCSNFYLSFLSYGQSMLQDFKSPYTTGYMYINRPLML